MCYTVHMKQSNINIIIKLLEDAGLRALQTRANRYILAGQIAVACNMHRHLVSEWLDELVGLDIRNPDDLQFCKAYLTFF